MTGALGGVFDWATECPEYAPITPERRDLYAEAARVAAQFSGSDMRGAR